MAHRHVVPPLHVWRIIDRIRSVTPHLVRAHLRGAALEGHVQGLALPIVLDVVQGTQFFEGDIAAVRQSGA